MFTIWSCIQWTKRVAICPLDICYIAIEHGQRQKYWVFPFKNDDFPKLCKRLPEGLRSSFIDFFHQRPRPVPATLTSYRPLTGRTSIMPSMTNSSKWSRKRSCAPFADHLWLLDAFRHPKFLGNFLGISRTIYIDIYFSKYLGICWGTYWESVLHESIDVYWERRGETMGDFCGLKAAASHSPIDWSQGTRTNLATWEGSGRVPGRCGDVINPNRCVDWRRVELPTTKIWYYTVYDILYGFVLVDTCWIMLDTFWSNLWQGRWLLLTYPQHAMQQPQRQGKLLWQLLVYQSFRAVLYYMTHETNRPW